MAERVLLAPLGRRRVMALMGLVLLVACVLLGAAQQAAAYQYDSAVGDSCHEDMVVSALRTLREELPEAAAPLSTSADDQLVIVDVPFSVPDDMHDIGAVSLMLGVRDNDVKGRSGLDTEELATIHGDPATQSEHCLRKPEHDGAEGAEQALAECRSYILERVDDAVRFGLDGDGLPSGELRSSLAVTLAFSGRVQPPLPHFYVRMGQALHALQDGFTHTYRSEDGLRVRTVLNWVDEVEGELLPARDGPAHLAPLDVCDDPDELRTQRHALAQQATTELLRAALAPGTIEQRNAAAAVVTQRYLSFEPGCTHDNAWCDAPEERLREAGCACRLGAMPATGATSAWSWGWVALSVLLWWARRRPRMLAAMVLCAAISQSAPASAQDDGEGAAASAQDEGQGAPTSARDKGESTPIPDTHPPRRGFAFHSSVAGAFDNGGLAMVAAGRYSINDHWLIGVDVEYNPWFSVEATRFAAGAFNSYATVIWRSLVIGDWALRSGAHVAASVILFDLVGVPAGSAGPYLGLSLLGLSYRIEEGVHFILDPADVALPIPRVTGAPFTYLQYRLAVGFQLGV